MLLRSVRFFSLPCTGVKPPGLMASSGKHSPSAKAADRATISPRSLKNRIEIKSGGWEVEKFSRSSIV